MDAIREIVQVLRNMLVSPSNAKDFMNIRMETKVSKDNVMAWRMAFLSWFGPFGCKGIKWSLITMWDIEQTFDMIKLRFAWWLKAKCMVATKSIMDVIHL